MVACVESSSLEGFSVFLMLMGTAQHCGLGVSESNVALS